ncbi:flavin-nucleotide-binding protein, partial [Pelomonas sp. HMWF004]
MVHLSDSFRLRDLRAERMQEIGRHVVRDHMPEQHQRFYEQLPF